MNLHRPARNRHAHGHSYAHSHACKHDLVCAAIEFYLQSQSSFSPNTNAHESACFAAILMHMGMWGTVYVGGRHNKLLTRVNTALSILCKTILKTDRFAN